MAQPAPDKPAYISRCPTLPEYGAETYFILKGEIVSVVIPSVISPICIICPISPQMGRFAEISPPGTLNFASGIRTAHRGKADW